MTYLTHPLFASGSSRVGGLSKLGDRPCKRSPLVPVLCQQSRGVSATGTTFTALNTRNPTTASEDPSSGSGSTPSQSSSSLELPDPEIIALDSGDTVLIPHTETKYEEITETCQAYLAEPMVISSDASLATLSNALSSAAYSEEMAFWVGINEFQPQLFTSKCLLLEIHPDQAVCFVDFFAFHRKYPDCLPQHSSPGMYVLDLYDDNCPKDTFRPVCQNGLACGADVDDKCGVWLLGCPFYGTCELRRGDSSSYETKTCLFPAPTIRLLEISASTQEYNVTCQLRDECLRTSYSSARWASLREQIYTTYYKDGTYYNKFDNINPIKVTAADLDSRFRCKYVLGGFSSYRSDPVYRPEIESDKTTVQLGDKVTLTCLDSGTGHIENEPISFEWSTPRRSEATIDNTLIKEDFSQADVGSYKCRAVEDAVPSVWSLSKELTLEYEAPVLEASEVEVTYGSLVSLICKTNNLPSGFSYYFEKEGAHLQHHDEAIPELFINPFKVQHVGVYHCWLKSDDSIVGPSNTVSLSMKPLLPPIIISDIGETVREGQAVNLTCIIFEDFQDIIEYVFTFQNFTGNGTTETIITHCPDLIISNFTAEDEGIYRCSVSLLDSRVSPPILFQSSNDSNVVRLRMISAILQSTATTVPEGSDVKLSCNITNYHGTVETYSWFKGDLSSVLLTTLKNTTTIQNFHAQNGGNYMCQAVLADPSVKDPPLTSRAVKLESAPRYQKCPCECSSQSLSVPPATPDVVEESTQAIQKNLSVVKAALSSNVRRVSSAPDSRPASVSAGYIAVALLSLVVCLVLVPDTITVAAFLLQTRDGQSREIARSAMKSSIENWTMQETETAHDVASE
ncbi:basement membrane-specific heparan sulfate proteoglycan core protein [Elysia marginata]|uniref:Basement membrane-specific heparan sulfate proteoglycan core protein n=1 Tax=Elysia marginata TaxID=1093978 RepID=A0AAV4GXD2_9GAST|nr:basement membrane-specific heparan sulfate proteoglycan core protein [Elysia marginata]